MGLLSTFISGLRAHTTTPLPDITILFAGQSNAKLLYENGTINSFQSMYQQYGGGSSTSIVAGYGGSALLKENASQVNNYWTEKNSNGSFIDGPRLTETIQSISNSSSNNLFNMIVWLQGERDSNEVENDTDKDNYTVALGYVFDRLKSVSAPDVKFGISVTGRRISETSNVEPGIQLIRQAQHNLAKERADVVILTETYDLELADHVHYSLSGQYKLLDRIAKSAASYMLGNGFIPSPEIRAVNLNLDDKTKLLVEIDHVEHISHGVDSDWLFSAHYDGVRIDVVSSHRISMSLLLLTLSSPISFQDRYNFKLHVGHGKYVDPVDISKSPSHRIRNEFKLPLATGIYELSTGRW